MKSELFPIVPNELLRAGRLAVGVARHRLAIEANLGARTIAAVERDENVSLGTLAATRDALTARGLLFLQSSAGSAGPGLRLPASMVNVEMRLVRAAAAALGLDTADFARVADVSESSVVRLLQPTRLRRNTLSRMRMSLEDRGISFLASEDGHGPGFRMRLDLIRRSDLRV